ncbi:hypothetical protein LF817_08115 [Halobacillus sp. A1]|uniref:hypothetical protein n=1 Tax=Halobacillus sp. A1 TaxID=2880262 RepID=UPI0020A6B48D|nr:hypothetical protein [Halobacillus sp. A1]MCP3031312.1 hypothetical protein [Halobacillus sp. A1]
MNNKEKNQMAQQVTEEIYEAYPTLWSRFGQNGRDRTEEDNHHHLDHLYAAYEMKSASFFLDYTDWLNTLLTSRGVGTNLIIDNFQRLIENLEKIQWEDEIEKESFIRYLALAIDQLRKLPQ